MFRVRRIQDNQWVTTPVHWDGVGVSESKAKARIFPESDRKYFELNDRLVIVPLAEDEIMSRLGQPRLEGF